MLTISRREFSKTMGTGLVVAMQLPLGGRLSAATTQAVSGESFEANAWIHIAPSGQITFILDKCEMGQGVYTGLPTIAAEELEADPFNMKVVFAPADLKYVNTDFNIQATGGSTSTKSTWMTLRQAGADARATLIEAAAQTWGVKAAECSAKDATVTHQASGRQLTYGELATKARSIVPVKGQLKDAGAFRLIGKPLGRIDALPKVTGSATFGLDVQVPGMVNAVVVRCPTVGGQVKSFDATEAQKMPGVVKVFAIDYGIAVVAQKFWQAKKAAEALKIEWNPGPLATLDDAGVTRILRDALTSGGKEVNAIGDAPKELNGRPAIEAEYELPYLAHAPMETVNCTAHVTKDRCTIWGPLQGAGPVQQFAVEETGLAHEQITVHSLFIGGSFGRKLSESDVKETLQIAMNLETPVKVTWTREDDMRFGFFRPVSLHQLKATLDPASGTPHAWHHRMASPSIMGTLLPSFVRRGMPEGLPEGLKKLAGAIAGGAFRTFTKDATSTEGAAKLPYAVPHFLMESAEVDPGLPVGFWRSVGHSHNGFVTESFIDELAHAAGKDPYEYRRTLLQDQPRHLAVLELAAEKANWGKPLPEGHFHGISNHFSFGSYVCQVAEVSVTGNTITVHKVTCAVDCGLVINPDNVAAQMESGIVYGLSAALHQRLTVDKGGIRESNFHDYPMLRINECPVISVHIVPSQEPPMGVGEPATPPIAAAVANAVFQATKIRIRRLPLSLGLVQARAGRFS